MNQEIVEVGMTPSDLAARLERGACVLVDVRERDEHARERIAEALCVPLAELRAESLPAHSQACPLVLCCASGARSREAAARLQAQGLGSVRELLGGLQGWRAAGLATVRDPRAPLPIMRQVQIVAGSLVLLGVLLGALVAPLFYGLSAFVGAGLVFAGVSGLCGMARLLELMPWNRRPSAAGSASSRRGDLSQAQ